MFLLLACQTPDTIIKPPPEDSAVDDTGPEALAPGPEFDLFCEGTPWDAALTEAEVPDRMGLYQGYNAGFEDFKRGTVESEKIIPAHPFHVRTVRVQYAAGNGTARIRLMKTMGRSYPGGYPELDTDGVNLMPPVEVEVDTTKGRTWVELDVSDQGIFLLPTEHYVIVNEYPTKGAPTVSIFNSPSGQSSHALIILPNEDTPYGLDGEFAMQLIGDSFCTWDARWFTEASTPFASDVSASATVADIDGNGHHDVVSYGAGPRAWMNDGTGTFTERTGLWPEAMNSNWLLFGDVDNDGDADAYASTYIGADDDGDDYTLEEGDCHNGDAAVHPGAEEATNGFDDDCDGVADDGTDTSDADGDGVSIAAGDCDDTVDSVFLGGVELRNGRDDDCDGVVDEDFSSRMLINDGTGEFTALESAGVETTLPSTAGGFGDADNDTFLDLYVGNWLEQYPYDSAVQDRYYEGNGDGTFADARDAAGLTLPEPFSPYGLTWNDYNNDGAQDIYVANYHLYDNQLWQNQGDGTFLDVAPLVHLDHDEVPTEQAKYPGGHSYGGEFADVDNDGDMDVFVANLSHPRTAPWADPTMFALNQGGPDFVFDNVREEWGLHYDEGDVNAQFADFDNDMDLDLAVASLYSTHYARVYRNDGDHFTDITYNVGVNVEDAVSVIWFDADEDGDEDLLVGDRGGDPYLHLFENTVGQSGNYVVFDLEGTTTNRDAVGARVTVTAGGVTQIRDVSAGNGCSNTQRPRRLHFGLGDNTTIDTVTVRWVGGDTETFTGAGAGGWWRLVEGTGAAAAR